MVERSDWLARVTTLAAVALVLGALGCGSAPAAEASDPATQPASTAGSGVPAPVCTFGQDQTCNDNPEISSLHGNCRSDGTCECQPAFPKNPATGRCP
jgi:hypothetical protein